MLAGEAGPGFGRASLPHRKAFALVHAATPDAWLWSRQPFAPGGYGTEHDPEKWEPFFRKACPRARPGGSRSNKGQSVERIPLMNPADVAQSALPMASTDVSLIALFLQAHWVVKAVMLGLLACSVWVWAIAIDKIFLYSRTKRAMDRFEKAFWSGQSIEELYRALSAKPTQSMAACFVAAMREWKRSFESQARSFTGLQMR